MAFTDTPDTEEAHRHRIQMLCDALRPDDPMRRLGFAALQGKLEDGFDKQLLVNTLTRARSGPWYAPYTSPYVRRWLLGLWKIHPEYTPREIAAWTLGHAQMPPEWKSEAVLALADTLREPGGRKAGIQIVNIGRGWLRGWLLFLAIYSTLALMFIVPSDRPPLAIMALFVVQFLMVSAMAATMFSPLFVGIALRQTNQHRDKMRAAAARSLGQLAAPEGLGALADALRNRLGDTRSAAIIALPAVVAALTPDWYGRMPAGATRDVCRALGCTSLPGPTRLLLVHALQVVGDGSGVSEIEALLAGPQPLYADRDGIKECLQAQLPLLRERLRLEQDDALLLRGSQQTATSQEQLLRAAAPLTTFQPPEQLLRAVQGDETVP